MGKRLKKRKNSQAPGGITQFLKELGLKPGVKAQSKKYWQEIRGAGGDPEKMFVDQKAFSVETNELFLNENIAKQTLSIDFKRIHDVLKNIESLNGFPERPEKICELGGGAGIFSIWLARKYPDCHITVYDQCQNPLKIGEAWAERLKLKNISFIQKSYSDLAKESLTQDNDLVFGINCLINCLIDIEQPKSSNSFLLKNLDTKNSKDSAVPLEEFAIACNKLSKRDGTIYLNPGSFNEFSLLFLLEAFRKNDISIDWLHTLPQGGGQGTNFHFDELHLFFRPGHENFLKNSWEDVHAIKLAALWTKKTIEIGPADFDTYFDLLSSGEIIAEIKVKFDSTNQEHLCLFHKSGMIGLFRSNKEWVRIGMLHSAAAIWEFVGQLSRIIYEYKQQGAEICCEILHPMIEAHIVNNISE